jgi:hypothetical protein
MIRLSMGFSTHSLDRMSRRRIAPGFAHTTMAIGREIHVRGATVYFIGREEVAREKRAGTDIRSLEGLCVVCSREGIVLTVYRNRQLRGLRRCRRGRNYRRMPNESHLSAQFWKEDV